MVLLDMIIYHPYNAPDDSHGAFWGRCYDSIQNRSNSVPVTAAISDLHIRLVAQGSLLLCFERYFSAARHIQRGRAIQPHWAAECVNGNETPAGKN